MKRLLGFPALMLLILLISEIGSYYAVRYFFIEKRSSLRTFQWIWWLATIGIYVSVFASRMIDSNLWKNIFINAFFLVLISKLVIALSLLITLFIQYLGTVFQPKEFLSSELENKGRRKFASQIALGMAAIPFTTMIWGIIKTAYDFKIHRETLSFPNLPNAFQGLKIVQISDIHTGSLQQESQLQKAIDLVKAENADIIVFTGDLVNNQSDEALPFQSILGQLSAPMGVFSILGNHDYGDYNIWESPEAKQKNMELMYQIHKDLNWKLLLNESVVLEKGSEKIALIGVENWGANLNFPKYGDLEEAEKEVTDLPFKVLLSHDPSHWTSEVIANFKDIDLTLSGHTHGFQFGVEIPGFKWSPSQYIYPKWAGLYYEGKQALYVNRGLGCLGYMGRVGIRPEITVLTLQHQA